MLKFLRVFLAIVSVLMVTLLFLDFTGTAQSLWPWMAKIQLMPAILSANVLIILGLVVLTLIFGRIYCSVICPLGIMQDIINWLHGRFESKKSRLRRFGWKPAKTKTRFTILAVFIILLILGLANVIYASIAGLVEPYSAYGRIASQILAPAYDGINNLLAAWSESRVNNYDFYRVAIMVSAPLLLIAIATLAMVGTMAWLGGRDYCNQICPVGTALGYLSKFSLFKFQIDTDKCVNCGICARKCKAKCINPKAHKIDATRCVVCMDCINNCSEHAISYTWRRKSALVDEATDKSRRGFLALAGFALGSVAFKSVAKVADGGLIELKDKAPVARANPIVPAGAQSIKHLKSKCTACQLCVQSCPGKVLKPTMSLDGFMQPTLDFTNGYCEPGCTKCSEVCPVGAILPVTPEEKTAIKIGEALVDLSLCLSASQGVNCHSCSTRCPAGAITMINVSDSSDRMMPIVDQGLCIGCGKCEYHCPSGTVASMSATTSAIRVNGLRVHRDV